MLRLSYQFNPRVYFSFNTSSAIRKDEDSNSGVAILNYATFANPYERPYDDEGNYEYDRSYNYQLSTLKDGYRSDFNILKELYDRAVTIHTTFIPFREHSRLLGIDSIDEYIRYGGTLRAGELDFDDKDVISEDASFRDDESTRRYIDTAICKNIQHSLSCCQDGGYFRHLQSLYEAGELTGAINRIIEDMNHRFLIRILTDKFKSHDLGSAADVLRRDRNPKQRTDILDKIDTEAVTKRLMDMLEIHNKEEKCLKI